MQQINELAKEWRQRLILIATGSLSINVLAAIAKLPSVEAISLISLLTSLGVGALDQIVILGTDTYMQKAKEFKKD